MTYRYDAPLFEGMVEVLADAFINDDLDTNRAQVEMDRVVKALADMGFKDRDINRARKVAAVQAISNIATFKAEIDSLTGDMND